MSVPSIPFRVWPFNDIGILLDQLKLLTIKEVVIRCKIIKGRYIDR
jgi:hypothetical protein